MQEARMTSSALCDPYRTVADEAQSNHISQIRIFNVAKIAGVISKSTEAKSVYEKLKQNVWKSLWIRYVFSLWQKSVKEEKD